MTTIEAPSLFPGPVAARPDAMARSGETNPAADFKSFLTLLTAQMRNQDPLQPIDSTEFVAQLANFSTVEQLVGTNERLAGLQGASAAQGIAALGGWIGRTVALADGSFRATGGPVAFEIPEQAGAESVTARVLDGEGTEVARVGIDTPALRAAFWDGRDSEGAFVTGKELRIVLDYGAAGTVATQRPAQVFREIVAVRGGENGVALQLSDGRSVAPEALSELRSKSAAGDPLAPAGG